MIPPFYDFYVVLNCGFFLFFFFFAFLIYGHVAVG